MRALYFVVMAACCPLGCSLNAPDTQQPVRPPTGVRVERVRVEAGAAEGISGLARDARGMLWGITERQHTLVPLIDVGDRLRLAGPAVTVEGVAEGIDTESLAWLGEDQFAVGTEARGTRERDWLLIAQATGERATVTEKIAVDYGGFGLRASDNRGIEGACATERAILLALEDRTAQGTGAVLVRHRKTGAWSLRTVALTTETGKLAGLDCAASASSTEIDVVATERHFGVARVLAFSIDVATAPSDAARVISPRVLIDLAPLFNPLPNLESLVRLPNGDLLLISDNHYGVVTGPTEAVRVSGLPGPAGEIAH